MAEPEAFEDVVRELIGTRSQRAVAVKAGVSATTIHDMLLGRVPQRDTLAKVARVICRTEEDEERLSRAAERKRGASEPETDLIRRTVRETTEEMFRRAGFGRALDLEQIEGALRAMYPEEVTYEPDMDAMSVETMYGINQLNEQDRATVARLARGLARRAAEQQGRTLAKEEGSQKTND